MVITLIAAMVGWGPSLSVEALGALHYRLIEAELLQPLFHGPHLRWPRSPLEWEVLVGRAGSEHWGCGSPQLILIKPRGCALLLLKITALRCLTQFSQCLELNSDVSR